MYLDWCYNWVRDTVEKLKPGGVLYVCGTTKTNTFLRFKLIVDEKFPLDYKNWVIWHYDWGGRPKSAFPRKHEDLLVWSKGKNMRFFADEIRVPYTIKRSWREGYELNPKGKIPTDVWKYQIHIGKGKEKRYHSTQKPEKLLERVIKAHTQEGDVVLDMFAGSGTTGIYQE